MKLKSVLVWESALRALMFNLPLDTDALRRSAQRYVFYGEI